MTTYAVYNTSTGQLVSIGTTIDFIPANLAYNTYNRTIDLSVERWNADLRDFEPIPPRTTTKISRQTFMDRIGDDSVVAIQFASFQNDIVGASLRAWLLRYQVVTEIDVADPRTIAGVDALIAAGLIPSNKRDEILAPEVVT